MEHPPQAGKFPDDGHGVGVGVPVVDDHRQRQLPGQGQLAAQHLLLAGAGDFPPVVVQADLTDGRDILIIDQSF